jgi:hypothetical protein
MRFNRRYRLRIKLGNDLLEVAPPTRVSFTGTRSMGTLSNVFDISIYNLSPNRYKIMTKDADTRANQFEFDNYTFTFEAGYEDHLGLVFAGQIHEASTRREGVDLITTISAIAGLHDLKHSFISQTINNIRVPDFVIGEMGLTNKGKVSDIADLKRPKVLLGNAFKILNDSYPDYKVFIDNNTCHIIKEGETTTDLTPVVDASTGLIGTPVRVQQRVSFETLLNSDITLGGNVDLQTTVSEYLNGLYNVESIEYAGDTYSDDWKQNVTAYNYAKQ